MTANAAPARCSLTIVASIASRSPNMHPADGRVASNFVIQALITV
jgi:hypothetical protein